MAGRGAFHVSVVTPEQAVVSRDDATLVVLPAHDGDLGVMRGHAPTLLQLGIGALRIETSDGKAETLYVDGGFAQIVDNRLSVLTEQAKDPVSLEPEAAAEAWASVRDARIVDDRAYEKNQIALQRAQVQKRMARS